MSSKQPSSRGAGPVSFSSVVDLSSRPSRESLGHASCSLSEESDNPIIAPLDTIEQVLSWEPCSDGVCVPSIGLRPRTDHNGGSVMDDPSAPKTLVCHDMMGGYIKDKFIQGHHDPNDYFFYQWQFIDAFMYFSHHFITLPPPVWTNMAHKNGVLSMGTIITEWEGGAKICQSLLSEDWKVTQFCDQLVAMAMYYKIDGWLVNIENPIHPMLMDRLQLLLIQLTTGMHAACPGSKVIWYDSVTTAGNLKWQNSLNQLNKPFFDLCDGIFLNYNWSEGGLAASRDLAGERRGEVYVGVDVFGRGCYGGGGFNSCKAVEVIHRQALSYAIFAPGWVYETLDKAHFFKNQERFWALLSPWLESRSVSSLPLVTAFGRGYGNSVSIDGKMVYSGQWTHHSAQDVQLSCPSLSALVTPDTQNAVKLEGVTLDTTTVYSNGASVRMVGSARNTAGMSRPALTKLFKTHFNMSSPLLVALTYSCEPPSGASIKVYLQLHTNGTPSRVFMDLLMEPSVDEETPTDSVAVGALPKSKRLSHLPGCVLAPLSLAHSRALHRTFTGGCETPPPWKTRYYVVDLADTRGSLIEEVSVGIYLASKKPISPGHQSTPQPYTLTLGEIKVLPTSLLCARYEVVNIWSHSYKVSADKTSLSLTLSWIVADDKADPIEHFNIYSSTSITSGNLLPWRSEYVYRGRAYANSYRLTDLCILETDAESSVSVCCVVQPVTVAQRKSAVEECPRLTLELRR